MTATPTTPDAFADAYSQTYCDTGGNNQANCNACPLRLQVHFH